VEGGVSLALFLGVIVGERVGWVAYAVCGSVLSRCCDGVDADITSCVRT
jgi:hypothetical protein